MLRIPCPYCRRDLHVEPSHHDTSVVCFCERRFELKRLRYRDPTGGLLSRGPERVRFTIDGKKLRISGRKVFRPAIGEEMLLVAGKKRPLCLVTLSDGAVYSLSRPRAEAIAIGSLGFLGGVAIAGTVSAAGFPRFPLPIAGTIAGLAGAGLVWNRYRRPSRETALGKYRQEVGRSLWDYRERLNAALRRRDREIAARDGVIRLRRLTMEAENPAPERVALLDHSRREIELRVEISTRIIDAYGYCLSILEAEWEVASAIDGAIGEEDLSRRRETLSELEEWIRERVISGDLGKIL